MSDILLLEAVSMFLGDADPEKSKHLKLTSMTLPNLEEQTATHNPGGGPGEVIFGMGSIKAVQPTFKMAGFDEEAFRLFAVGQTLIQNITCYGVIRSKREGKALQGKAIFRGKIGKITADAYERGKEFGHDYNLIDVTHYELSIGGQSWYNWDFWTTPKPIVFGNEDREYLAMLGLA